MIKVPDSWIKECSDFVEKTYTLVDTHTVALEFALYRQITPIIEEMDEWEEAIRVFGPTSLAAVSEMRDCQYYLLALYKFIKKYLEKNPLEPLFLLPSEELNLPRILGKIKKIIRATEEPEKELRKVLAITQKFVIRVLRGEVGLSPYLPCRELEADFILCTALKLARKFPSKVEEWGLLDHVLFNKEAQGGNIFVSPQGVYLNSQPLPLSEIKLLSEVLNTHLRNNPSFYME